MKFYSFDLDLDLMTLVLRLDLDTVKMHVCTEYEVHTFSSSKHMAETDTRQTDGRIRLDFLPTRICGW